MSGKKTLPIGIDDFKKACSDSIYLVDKTLMIKDIIDSSSEITLFTRPRRFGKTLNMSMIQTFFEHTGKDTSFYFKDKKIWQEGEKYREKQGKYPVIFLTFKDVKRETWEEASNRLTSIISTEFKRHSELINSNKCDSDDIKEYLAIKSKNSSLEDLGDALLLLSRMLYAHYGEKSIIIIDEYDTPLQQAYEKGYYDEAISFFRVFFSSALKGNPNLEKGFLTGILRVAKEGIFSGLNNLEVSTILNGTYSEYFGFTKDEVKEMAHYYERDDKIDEIKEWYDGYKFGEYDIYNPWSVINYFRYDCVPKAYWSNTSSNSILGSFIFTQGEETAISLVSLTKGESVTTAVKEDVIYPELGSDSDYVFSFLLFAGYLKTIDQLDTRTYNLTIPNKEIREVYEDQILSRLSTSGGSNNVRGLKTSLRDGKPEEVKKYLDNFLKNSLSTFNNDWRFYEGLIAGLSYILSDDYSVVINREVGDGRADTICTPKNKKYPGIIIEIKTTKKENEDLEKLAIKAVKQIEKKEYFREMKTNGLTTINTYGVAFRKKDSELKYKEYSY